MSSYIIERCPNRYGGNQENFNLRAAIIASTTATLIKRAVDNYDNLEELFHQTLSSLSKARKTLAIKYNIANAEFFGLRRDSDTFDDISSSTDLTGALTEYNDRIIAAFQTHLRNLQPFTSGQKTVATETWLGRESSITFRLLLKSNRKEWGYEYSPKHHQQMCAWCGVSPDAYPFTAESMVSLGRNKEAMANLKRNNPTDYLNYKIDACISNMNYQHPETQDKEWILVTVRNQVDGKMYALSQYLLNLPDAPTMERRIAAMKHKTSAAVLHQDTFLIEPMLADLAKIFKQAIMCNTHDIKTLKEHMTLFKYQFSHVSPFFRGSATISEWIERAVYEYQGYTLKYNNNKMPTLEAWTSSLKEFADNYDSIVTVTSV